MKLRTATPASVSFSTRLALIIVSIVMLLAVPLQMVQNASADEYDDRINALKGDIDIYNAELAKLSAQSKTLQSAIAALQNQAAAIQAQINISQAKYDQLVARIAETEKKIKDSQDALGVTIASMYVDDEVSPIELLAGSKNISEFMDKQEYRASVRDELTSIIAKVKQLKIDLENQKVEASRVLEDQKNQHNALVAKQNEQQALLDQTQGDEANYQSLVAKSNQQIDQIKAEQAAYFQRISSGGTVINVSAGDPNKGGYPGYLAGAYQDTVVDPWGMYNRECVSYTAWKVYQAYGNMPYWGGIGNAWQWGFSGYQLTGWDTYGWKVNYDTGTWHTANSTNLGIPSGTTPKIHSVAVRNANGENDHWGHVAWVEAVNGDGTIDISQYNWYNAGGAGWGNYSEMTIEASFFQSYIYFGEW